MRSAAHTDLSHEPVRDLDGERFAPAAERRDADDHGRQSGDSVSRSRPSAPWLGGAGAAAIAFLAGLGYLRWKTEDAPPPAAPPPAQVTVSKPLQRQVDERLGFLGQFSAVDRVELRAQVGGTLTDIRFKDGALVQKGDVLFVIDPAPYEIKLAQADAQLENALARLDLANRELVRAQALRSTNAGTERSVDQRSSDQKSAQSAVDDAKAQIRDARFDLDRCRIVAPFSGRIGTHLVSVGALIAGSRAATSPTTLLATIVSLDPIYLNFDMSESDYLEFSRTNADRKGGLGDAVEIKLSDETRYARRGTLDFVDNVLDRSSGTLHARATVANPDLFLTPGEFAKMSLVLGVPVTRLLIPDAAIVPDQSQHMVMTVGARGTVVPKQVELGDIRDGLRVVRSGLDPNDQVVIEGIPFASPGTKVIPQPGTIKASTAPAGS